MLFITYVNENTHVHNTITNVNKIITYANKIISYVRPLLYKDYCPPPHCIFFIPELESITFPKAMKTTSNSVTPYMLRSEKRKILHDIWEIVVITTTIVLYGKSTEFSYSGHMIYRQKHASRPCNMSCVNTT